MASRILFAVTVLCIGRVAAAQTLERPTFSVEKNVAYSKPGESFLKADLYRPKSAGPHPAILMIHGGAWFSGSKVNVGQHAMWMVKRGYFVMAINYRLAPTHKFPAQIEDCLAALEWMGMHAGDYAIDVSRIAAYGYSAGGHLACLLGTIEDSDFRPDGKAKQAKRANLNQAPSPPKDVERPAVVAVVAGGAPCEFRQVPEDSRYLAYWLGGTRGEIPDVYKEASPTVYVSADDPPVFFFHGDKDRVVSLTSSDFLRVELQRWGVRNELHVVRDVGHLGAFMDTSTIDLAGDFLDSVLRPDHKPKRKEPSKPDMKP